MTENEMRYAYLWFALLALLVASMVAVGCALFSNQLIECRKSCGQNMMAYYDEGQCICKETNYN
jgi:hypothetical protein